MQNPCIGTGVDPAVPPYLPNNGHFFQICSGTPFLNSPCPAPTIPGSLKWRRLSTPFRHRNLYFFRIIHEIKSFCQHLANIIIHYTPIFPLAAKISSTLNKGRNIHHSKQKYKVPVLFLLFLLR